MNLVVPGRRLVQCFDRLFDGGFAPMAQQCSLARLDDPVICCGSLTRTCGRHACGVDYTDANHRFWRAGELAGKREKLRLVEQQE